MHTCIHKYIYRPPSCPKVCQTVGPFPISEFARLRSFTFHHPPRVCQTLSSYKSFHHHFFFWSIIDALSCSLLPIKGSGCHPLARCMGVDRCGERFYVLTIFASLPLSRMSPIRDPPSYWESDFATSNFPSRSSRRLELITAAGRL